MRNDKVIAALAEGTELPGELEIAGTAVEPLAELRRQSDDAIGVVLPLLHGPHGEDGTIQGMLELFGLPYVGAGVLSSAVCMDKAMAKVVAAQAGIPQCRWLEFRDGVDDPRTIAFRAIEEMGLPLFVKPANMGSSVGITKAHDAAELDAAINLALRYDDVVVIEEMVDGREVEVAVLGNALPETSVPGEIMPGSEFYDYEDKYITGAAKLVIPAPLSAQPPPTSASSRRRCSRDALRGHGTRGLLLRGVRSGLAPQRGQHDSRFHPGLDVSEALGCHRTALPRPHRPPGHARARIASPSYRVLHRTLT